MTDLLPLTLSSSSSSSSHSNSTEECLGHKFDQYFAEILAEDLELSKGVFAAKNMSAGMPISSSLASDREATNRRLLSSNKILFTVPHHAGSAARTPSLGPIEERNSKVSFLSQHSVLSDDTGSQSESDSLAESSASGGGMAPPSVPRCEQSILTSATSMESTVRRHSGGISPSFLNGERYWAEGDSEDEDADNEGLGALSPRPPTPPEYDLAPGKTRSGRRSSQPRAHGSCSSRKATFGNGGGSLKRPKRVLSGRSDDAPVRQTPAHLTYTPADQPTNLNCQTTAQPLSRLPPVRDQPQLSVTPCPPKQTFRGRKMKNIRQRTNLGHPSPPSEGYSESDGDRLQIDPPSWARSSTIYIQPSPPPSPLPTVQSYLNSLTGPYTPLCGANDDGLAKAVPLPPDVIETLRVSIACFPETMLLSSSLTIETIRAYSRKVRHPSLEPSSRSSSPESKGSSIWKKFASYKRGSVTSLPRSRESRGSNQSSSLSSSPSSTSLEAPKPWVSLKNVFGCCSDYICDALYAHIVAYNYISSLVPPQLHSNANRKRSDGTGVSSSNDDIPKKAASLLGIGGPVTPPHQHTHGSRLSRKFSVRWGTHGRDDMATTTMSNQLGSVSTAHDNAVRDIQTGLMRCIGRLMATAKLMAENGGGEDGGGGLTEGEVREGDALFTRSLCEIVRLAEGRLD